LNLTGVTRVTIADQTIDYPDMGSGCAFHKLLFSLHRLPVEFPTNWRVKRSCQSFGGWNFSKFI